MSVMPPNHCVRLLGSLLLLAAIAAGQDPPPGPKPDPSLPEQLDRLREMVKDRRMQQDYQAIELIRVVAAEPQRRTARDRDRIVDAIGDVFRTGRLRPPDKVQLYETAGDTLAEFGEAGAKRLHAALTDDRIDGRDYRLLRARMIRALGRTKDDHQVEWLLDQALRSPDDDVVAAAGAALGEYGHLPTPRLRDIVKRMISRYGEWDMQARQLDPIDPNAPIDFGPQNARETLRHIAGDWNATLARLTGVSLQTAPDWQHWQNKNTDWVPPGREHD
jgi:hypothetical protein